MDEESSVLNEIVKAKECIKRKYSALKTGEENVQKLMSQTFKPVIEPLEKISNQSSLTPQITEKINKTKQLVIEPVESFLEKETDEGDTPEAYYLQKIYKWFSSNELDKIYGPKIDYSNGDITLGNKNVRFVQDTLIIDDSEYTLTPGLVRLLFKKHPNAYTENDLHTYKTILVQTYAHLTSNGAKIKKGGKKYLEIIEKLFPFTTPSGSGISMKLQKHNLVYWDDPNELVDRLKLLLSSQAAGNTAVSNEIIYIFEELLEAGLIKRIPNV